MCLQSPTIFYFYFSQLLSVHNVSDVRQREVDTPLVSGPSRFEVDLLLQNLLILFGIRKLS
jgi:hypothetical protein